MSYILSLPLELLQQIVGYLALRDICHLTQAYKELDHFVLSDEKICQRIVQVDSN
jgi:hypothetical protein